VKETIASSAREDGKDIQLTIDAELQADLYGQMKEVPGCSVAIQPYTGETLALVSTPGYDSNDFVQGMSQEKWDSLNTDVKKPLYNRFRQNWCPGSTFKPVIAAIGLKNNAFDPAEDFGNEGLSWQKDSSWGSYYVTTLQAYEPVIMKNAIIYSDNIYFAKAALRIGSERFMKSLDELGFNQKLPFEITMSDSQYSNTERIETEIQLADSGYGQGQILVNPLHLASMYTAFLNGGNMVKPYIQYKEEAIGTVWKEQMFSEDIINQVMEGMTGVVNDPRGTAYGAHRDDRILAGKTGTAEIKAAKEDVNGTEIGWFSVFTAEKDTPQPILLISMVENVKEIGGSGYVVNGDKEVLDRYFK
jgi:cell division protein FtsI/penicillin-binding protein 2